MKDGNACEPGNVYQWQSIVVSTVDTPFIHGVDSAGVMSLRWVFDGFRKWVLRAKSRFFSAAVKQNGEKMATTVPISPCMPIILGRVKLSMAPVSFKCDVWKNKQYVDKQKP